MREPGSIRYQRKIGIDPVLEALGAPRPPGASAYVIVFGMGSRIVYLRWYARSVDEARRTFKVWMSEPWQTLATDFTGVGVPNGMDFKPGRIDWFNIAP